MTRRAVRTTVALPEAVANALKEHIPAGERSEFIAETVRKELARRRFLKGLRGGAGAWKDEDHPELMTHEDMRRYLRELRDPKRWRSFNTMED